ncbi:ImmA/IrrE family metallo-endopeptidase [Xylocopilactobacillus apis]|nr:ImmA/IrrE family metallo-endopeptidase [Xylocopilactobacillus apis]BDR57473.1 DNA-binding protein [Xylocopilactobacillus apis]
MDEQIPKEENSFVNFRTINNLEVYPSRRLIDTIHSMQTRQEWLKDYLIEQNGEILFQSIPKFTFDNNPQTVANKITELLDFSKVYQRSRTDIDTFNVIRKSISSLGITVMQNGIVGNDTHRTLDVNEFRAFALYDEIAPMIFINSCDSVRGKIFSLLHELIHILVGENEILNVGPDSQIKKERWINQVTVNILMPENVFKDYINDGISSQENLKRLSNKFHTSLVSTAIRAKELNISDNCNELIKWAKEQQSKNLVIKSEKKESEKRDFYTTALSRVDRRYASAVINSESSGELPLRTAASMLGVGLKSYYNFVNKVLGIDYLFD